jgi:hypothetical protein
MVESSKIEDLLLKMLEDISYIKAKLESIEEQQLGSRIDAIEAQNKEHDHVIKSLENRACKTEEFIRNNVNDTKKQQTSVFISLGIAVFSAVLSIITRLF